VDFETVSFWFTIISCMLWFYLMLKCFLSRVLRRNKRPASTPTNFSLSTHHAHTAPRTPCFIEHALQKIQSYTRFQNFILFEEVLIQKKAEETALSIWELGTLIGTYLAIFSLFI